MLRHCFHCTLYFSRAKKFNTQFNEADMACSIRQYKTADKQTI